MKLQEDRLVRINQLAKKQREEGLSEVEKKEQHDLRQAFLKTFREGFRQTLDNTVIVDHDGNRRALKKEEGPSISDKE